MKRLSKILPHITIILAGMFIVFWILDILNPTMNNAESHGSAFFYGQIFLKNICIVPD